MERYYYPYDEFKSDIKKIIKFSKKFKPDAVVGVARGGLTISHFVGIALNLRDIYSLNSIHYSGSRKLEEVKVFNIPNLSDKNRVLIVDDIIDSGESMAKILDILKERFPKVEFKVATIFYKKTAIYQPDFSPKEATKWIDFFWEIDPIDN
jgi:xanthine phosphoribosyltransferase